jgi:hypothetical protein
MKNKIFKGTAFAVAATILSGTIATSASAAVEGKKFDDLQKQIEAEHEVQQAPMILNPYEGLGLDLVNLDDYDIHGIDLKQYDLPDRFTAPADIQQVVEYFGLNKEETVQLLEAIGDREQLEQPGYGKFTWAVAAIKKAWHKLPDKVKGVLGGASTTKFFHTLEHYTGAIEDGIYEGFLRVTGNKTLSRMLAKTVMLLVF